MDEILDLLTRFGSTSNYSATADLHTWQFTAPVSLLCLQQSFPGNGFQHSNCTSLAVTAGHMKSFCAAALSQLDCLSGDISSQSSSTVVSKDSLNYSLSLDRILIIWLRGVSNRKHHFHRYRSKISRLLLIRCRGNLYTESLPNDERLFWLRCYGFQVSCHSIQRNKHCKFRKSWTHKCIQ
jgi:hypothetical protein